MVTDHVVVITPKEGNSGLIISLRIPLITYLTTQPLYVLVLALPTRCFFSDHYDGDNVRLVLWLRGLVSSRR